MFEGLKMRKLNYSTNIEFYHFQALYQVCFKMLQKPMYSSDYRVCERKGHTGRVNHYGHFRGHFDNNYQNVKRVNLLTTGITYLGIYSIYSTEILIHIYKDFTCVYTHKGLHIMYIYMDTYVHIYTQRCTYINLQSYLYIKICIQRYMCMYMHTCVYS